MAVTSRHEMTMDKSSYSMELNNFFCRTCSKIDKFFILYFENGLKTLEIFLDKLKRLQTRRYHFRSQFFSPLSKVWWIFSLTSHFNENQISEIIDKKFFIFHEGLISAERRKREIIAEIFPNVPNDKRGKMEHIRLMR